MSTRQKRFVAAVAGLSTITVFVLIAISWNDILDWWRFRQVFQATGRNEQGYPEYRHRQTGIIMVSLPGGTFWMGAQKDDPKESNYDPEAQDDEGPVHEVILSPFLIARHEVTQEQWELVMESRSSHFSGDNLPVERVSWEDGREFCEKTGLSLPSEAQWEYACRGGSGGVWAGSGNLEEMGWYKGNSGGAPQSVGEKRPNGFGLYDMHGNVWEWCADWYKEDYYAESSGRRDPECRDSNSGYRVNRGGSWNYSARLARTAQRYWMAPSVRTSRHHGFRPVWRAEHSWTRIRSPTGWQMPSEGR